jgi:hypothetical protein
VPPRGSHTGKALVEMPQAFGARRVSVTLRRETNDKGEGDGPSAIRFSKDIVEAPPGAFMPMDEPEFDPESSKVTHHCSGGSFVNAIPVTTGVGVVMIDNT